MVPGLEPLSLMKPDSRAAMTEPRPILSAPPFRNLQALRRSPWAFFSPGWRVPAPPASPHTKDDAVPSLSSWPYSDNSSLHQALQWAPRELQASTLNQHAILRGSGTQKDQLPTKVSYIVLLPLSRNLLVLFCTSPPPPKKGKQQQKKL